MTTSAWHVLWWLGQAVADGTDYEKLQRTKKPQTAAAYGLMKAAGLTYREFTMADMPKFQAVRAVSDYYGRFCKPREKNRFRLLWNCCFRSCARLTRLW